MEFAVWARVLIVVGCTIFTILTWVPVGGASVWLWKNISAQRILFDMNLNITEDHDIWLGYIMLVIYLEIWAILFPVWMITKAIAISINALRLSIKFGKRLSI